jgi:DNA-binding PadR family transcriptional regulator
LRYYVARSNLAGMTQREHDTDRAVRSNDPPVLILTSLASGPKHGYALLQDIEAFAGVRLGPGTLYGAIARLEERGLIEPAGEAGRRRPYRLTAAGATELESTLASLRAIVNAASSRLAGLTRVVTLGGLA